MTSDLVRSETATSSTLLSLTTYISLPIPMQGVKNSAYTSLRFIIVLYITVYYSFTELDI